MVIDTLPTKRSLHGALHFVHRKQELKRHVWIKPANSNWGELYQFFERVKFQNRGAAHTQSCIWVSKSKEQMITDHIIRSDLPNPEHEPGEKTNSYLLFQALWWPSTTRTNMQTKFPLHHLPITIPPNFDMFIVA
jgi:hypothetical protein